MMNISDSLWAVNCLITEVEQLKLIIKELEQEIKELKGK